jgi:hypothetical protein
MKRIALVVLGLLIATGGCLPGGSIIGEQLVVTSFNADPLRIAPGQSSTLSWTVQGASRVEILPGVGSVGISGSRVVTPSATTLYTLSASNSAGKTTVVTVQVVVSGAPSPSRSAPVVGSFNHSPSPISPGQSTMLSWNVLDATSVSIDHGLGSVASSGNATVSPTATTTYVLTATNAYGSTTAVAVVIVATPVASGPPVIEYMMFNPPSMHPGQTSVLSWKVTGATSVALDRGIGPVDSTGTRTVSVQGTTNYTLTASNSYGWASRTTPIVVTAW